MKKFSVSNLVIATTFMFFSSINADYANRQIQYDAKFSSALEMVGGEGYLANGGEKKLKEIFKGIPLDNKKMLDFGCGLGGPALYLATNNFVDIIGVDVEEFVLSKLNEKIASSNLEGSIRTQLIDPETTLPFADNSFNILYAGESMFHIKNKKLILAEMYRVLKPKGLLIVNDYMHFSKKYSAELKAFLIADGLGFHLISAEDYQKILHEIGFSFISAEDVTDRELEEAKYIIKQMESGPLGKAIQAKYNKSYLDDYIKSWKLEAHVYENYEMPRFVFKAVK